MAETFIAIGASIKAAAGAAAASISSMFAGGSTAAAGAGAVSTGASTLSTALSIGSALSSVAGGFANAAAAKDQARQVAVQTAQMKARDSQERASLAEEYADLVADQTSVQIANGLNPGVGTPASVRKATANIAERNLSTSRENTRNRTAVARMQQRSLMKSANNMVLSGFVAGANTGMDAYRAVG